jgi:hypothetical protein
VALLKVVVKLIYSGVVRLSRLAKGLLVGGVCYLWLLAAALGQGTQPIVAIHDSELTRALESMPATNATPRGAGMTSNEWWTTDWHYFVMPASVKEALRSDGTAFTVVGDSNITAGLLLTNGLPKYPIVISLASEAIRDDEIGPLTNYVAAGGFLLVGSSAFTRNTNGTTRGDFAFSNELGVHMVVHGLTNWTTNGTFTASTNHPLVADIPLGQNTWRMPSSSEEISWGTSPTHAFLAPHDVWQVSAATNVLVLATGDNAPFLTVRRFGKGYFIYHAAFQPLVGHGGFAPGMYAYMIFRRAIEWAFASANLPIPKLSPWPYPYDAAFMIRHDLENFTTEISNIQASAQAEFNYGAKGDYYFCTGTLRDDVSGPTRTNIVTGLRRAVTNYNATIGPHNGGLRNPGNLSLTSSDYDYWHWGPDEALDVIPAGYASGKAYASASISNSFKDVEGWLSGITNGLRTWVSCYFNGTREDSYDLQAQLGVNIAGDQKLSPFPHWTLSTRTPDKRYSLLTEPVSDWYVGGGIAQSMEPWHPPGVHTSQTVHDAVDFYYRLGALINIYSHCLSTGAPSDAPPSSGNAYLLVPDYITYSLNTNLHPRLWSANAVGVYKWWLQRSNAQVSVNYATNGSQSVLTVAITGANHTNTAVEVVLPTAYPYSVQVLTNGSLASGNTYRAITNPASGQQVIKLRVGITVTNAVISYYALTAPVLPAQTNRTITEWTTLVVTNTASDPDAPLMYTLLTPPAGAVIDTNGVITWTPTQAQSPSTNLITTLVTDSALPPSSATNSFSVIVREVNTAPILPVQADRTINVLTTLSVTNTAIETNIHAVMGYTLVSPPFGAGINSNGIITWTPSLLQSPSTNTITTVVTNTDLFDPVNPHLSATNSFEVVVVNGPVIALDSTVLAIEGCMPTNNAIDPGETVTVLFAFKNVGAANTTNLVVTLWQTNGIAAPSAPQSYGVLVAGGEAVSQPFTLTAAGACGGSITATLQLQDGSANLGTVTVPFTLGQTGAVFTQSFDAVTAPNLPSGWTTSASNAQSGWVTTNSMADTAPNAAYSIDARSTDINELVSPPILLSLGQTQLSFRHSYSFEADPSLATNGYDGGVLEIKIGTNSFTDIINNGGSWIANGYNRRIDTRWGNPLAGRGAWSGTNAGFVTSIVALPPASAGQTIQLRWRAGSDSSEGGDGWWVDTVSVVAQTCCANAPPILPGQANWTIAVMTTLIVTNTATSPGAPANPLSYLLVNPPAGAVIDSNGVIAWTPTETQSPSTNTITTAAINSGVPSLSVTNSFTVVVREVNVAPILPFIPDQTVDELTLLAVTNTAFETDIHATLGYTLVNPPAGASIDADGIITWIPSQAQSPSTNTLTTVVTNTNPYDLVNPHLSATNSFTVVVREVNVAPVLPFIPDQTVDELTLLAVTNTAFETNIHATLGYTLVNPPAGASIDADGIITWTPSQTQSPSTNTIITVVTNTNFYDQVNPHLSATNSFAVVVREVNVAPVLPFVPDQTVDELTLLTVTNTAFETNIHSKLGYMLVNPPAGASIDADGIITWTPSQAQSPSTNTIITVVTNTNLYDLVNPHLSATNSFTVVVNAAVVVLPPLIQSTTVSSGIVTITWSAVPGRSYLLERKDGLDGTNWDPVSPPASATGVTATATDAVGNVVQRLYRVVLQP